MMKALFLATLAALGASAAQAVPVTWVDWTEVVTDNTGTTVKGTMAIGSDTVDVTYFNAIGISFAQTVGGTDYWGGVPSPYTSVGPKGNDNAPGTSDIVALQFAGLQTLSFSKAISDVYFAFVSLNGNGYGFDRDFTILSSGGENIDGAGTDACGYWGCGTSSKQIVGSEYQLIGIGEPHGTLLLTGTFSSVSWRSLSSENWNGFTVGVAGVAPPPGPSPIPVPAAGVLLAGGLALLAGLRRRRG
jgi:hypothetical protein